MGLFTHAVAGVALIITGAWESLSSAFESRIDTPSQSQSQFPPQNANSRLLSSSSTVTFLSISFLSLAFILNSLASIYDASGSKDHIGSALQLEVIAVASLFLLYSGLGIYTNAKGLHRSPGYLLDMIYAFAFAEEFLLFYKQIKDPSGVENRYYDLFLVPIGICLFSTLLELKSPESNYPRFGRGIGLVLQGMWTLQMGFSFYSSLITSGCDLHQRSRGNYTVKCKGHMEYHRGRAIATLQFNCHLAFLVTLVVGLYSLFCKKHGISKQSLKYKPLGAGVEGGLEMSPDSHSHFALDSDEEDDRDGLKESGSRETHNVILSGPNSTVNGYGSHS